MRSDWSLRIFAWILLSSFSKVEMLAANNFESSTSWQMRSWSLLHFQVLADFPSFANCWLDLCRIILWRNLWSLDLWCKWLVQSLSFLQAFVLFLLFVQLALVVSMCEVHLTDQQGGDWEIFKIVTEEFHSWNNAFSCVEVPFLEVRHIFGGHQFWSREISSTSAFEIVTVEARRKSLKSFGDLSVSSTATKCHHHRANVTTTKDFKLLKNISSKTIVEPA